MRVLVTGGAGYIGSHTTVELLQDGHEVVVVDNLSNSSVEAVKRVEKIAGKAVTFYKVDVTDKIALDAVFDAHEFDAVIHFAGLKAVGESIDKALLYYHTNLLSTITLCEVMEAHAVKKLIFSSSATVYGTPAELPLTEDSPTGTGITNPYGQTKYMLEQILRDVAHADPTMEITVLRYFNPVGAHPSGEMGEDPSGVPNNLLPFVSQVAIGKHKELTVHGNDYPTPDGTAIRDYIHVVDLALGHVAALAHMKQGWSVYNLGTGVGTSVLEIVQAFSKACGHDIPYHVGQRRHGDIASCYAAADKAENELKWHAERSIQQACEDTWRWQLANPDGYKH